VGRDAETHGADVTHRLEATAMRMVITTHTHLMAPSETQSCAVGACYLRHMSPATTQGVDVK